MALSIETRKEQADDEKLANRTGRRSHEARQLPTYRERGRAGGSGSANSAIIRRWSLPAKPATLPADLAAWPRARRFLLQGGDCAESFAEFHPNNIRDTFRVLLQMAVVLTFASKHADGEARPHGGPVRQAARSADMEDVEGVVAAELSRRHHQRHRLRGSRPRARPGAAWSGAYNQSAATLNLLRAFAQRRLCQPAPGQRLDARLHGSQPVGEAISRTAARISEALAFMEACGVDARNRAADQGHQLLHQPRRRCCFPMSRRSTRQDSLTGGWYDTSGHFLWVGDRTRFEGSAHIEYLRGIGNPVGMKCGPSLEPDVLLRLLDTLDPNHVAGRVTLITRYGHDKIEAHLPKLVRAVKRSRAVRRLVVRPDARQCHQDAQRLQDAPVRAHPRRSAWLLRRPPRRGHAWRRHPYRDDRPECYRMHRRRDGRDPDGPRRPLSHALRPAVECRTSRWNSAFLLAEMLNQEMAERAKQAA